jgi:hypothetical protein
MYVLDKNDSKMRLTLALLLINVVFAAIAWTMASTVSSGGAINPLSRVNPGSPSTPVHRVDKGSALITKE